MAEKYHRRSYSVDDLSREHAKILAEENLLTVSAWLRLTINEAWKRREQRLQAEQVARQ